MLQEMSIDGLQSVRVWDTGDRDRPIYFYCKRVMDVSLTTMLLILLSPVMLLTAIAIKLDSRGPVFFSQERVGTSRRSHKGSLSWEIRNFRMYKFRSMVNNADNSLHEAYIKAWVEGRAEAENGSGTKFKLTNDPRITRVGRIIRKTSLDELPQLFNVLRGEMSLVGPRPVPTYEVEQYEDWHCERLAALPGLTGIWQVKGRGQVPFEEQVRMDIEYVRRQSLWLDVQLLLLTIPAVVSGDGAQ
jgi:lipopolysaccharide/colanic/teichoic acid biosynthesis glycosyltransferase